MTGNDYEIRSALVKQNVSLKQNSIRQDNAERPQGHFAESANRLTYRRLHPLADLDGSSGLG